MSKCRLCGTVGVTCANCAVISHVKVVRERDEAKRQLRLRINELDDCGFRIERITERAEKAEREWDAARADAYGCPDCGHNHRPEDCRVLRWKNERAGLELYRDEALEQAERAAKTERERDTEKQAHRETITETQAWAAERNEALDLIEDIHWQLQVSVQSASGTALWMQDATKLLRKHGRLKVDDE